MFLLLFISVSLTSPAQAQLIRTWVSDLGSDANMCTWAAPCRNFAAALAKTATSGEVNVKDSANFMSFTIQKSVTINGGGVKIGVGGTITVNGAGAVVILSNLDLAGFGDGSRGIRFVQGAALHVENVAIRGFRGASSPTGIEFAPSGTAKLFVHNVTINNCGSGTAAGGGIIVKPTGAGSKNILLDNVRVENCSRGLVFDGAGNTGTMYASVIDSTVFGNAGAGIVATAPVGGGIVRLKLDGVTSANNNAQGILANGPNARIIIGNSLITDNTIGVQASGGTIRSFKNNQIIDNSSDGTPLTAVSLN